MTQLELVPPDYADPVNVLDQVNRIPGIDAPCPRDLGRACHWPYCTCGRKPDNEGDDR